MVAESEWFFQFAFTLESCLKILALGFWCEGKTAYLRDSWNMLDFIIVLLGWFAIMQDFKVFGESESANFTAFRTIRVLRPLRALKSVPGLGRLIGALMRSANQLGKVGLVGNVGVCDMKTNMFGRGIICIHLIEVMDY